MAQVSRGLQRPKARCATCPWTDKSLAAIRKATEHVGQWTMHQVIVTVEQIVTIKGEDYRAGSSTTATNNGGSVSF